MLHRETVKNFQCHKRKKMQFWKGILVMKNKCSGASKYRGTAFSNIFLGDIPKLKLFCALFMEFNLFE